MSPLYTNDIKHLDRFKYLAGTDEAGRGPLAGPVVAAAVILDLSKPIDGLDDSKKLTEKKREILYGEILSNSLATAVAISQPAEIDRINILQASLTAMERAIAKLSIKPCYILIDGNKLLPNIPLDKQQYLVKGDSISASIAAASIVAKVVRDRVMLAWDKHYPAYGFKKHKGYPTKAHREAILSEGLSPIHRRSFSVKGLDIQPSFLD